MIKIKEDLHIIKTSNQKDRKNLNNLDHKIITLCQRILTKIRKVNTKTDINQTKSKRK